MLLGQATGMPEHLPAHSRTGGFSMIELVSTFAVVAVLAAVALPMYRDYQSTARMTDTIIKLERFAREIEFHYQTRGELPGFRDIGLNSAASSYEDVFDEHSEVWNLLIYHTTANGRRALLVIHSRSPHQFDNKLWQIGLLFQPEDGVFRYRCAANTAAQEFLPQTCQNSLNDWQW